MRTLYQHTARHHPATLAYMERVEPYAVEVRTLEEIIDRLIIVDRRVAFIPARSDRQVALELRHEGLVQYLVGVFEQFWLHAVPWAEPVAYAPSSTVSPARSGPSRNCWSRAMSTRRSRAGSE